jgi:hypothetical protein
MQTLAAEALKTLIITSVVIVAGPVFALVSASNGLARAPDGCRGVQLGMVEAVVISDRVANRDNARFLKALRQELSRRNLTRARLKECAPQWDPIISKWDRCAASSDTECRFSQQEVDEINKASDAPTAPP